MLFAASVYHSVAAVGWWECIACFLSLMTLSFDLWPWHSNSSEWGTKHVFPVNLAQIRLAVPEIFDAKTKKSETAIKKQNLTQFTACGNYTLDVIQLLTVNWLRKEQALYPLCQYSYTGHKYTATANACLNTLPAHICSHYNDIVVDFL